MRTPTADEERLLRCRRRTLHARVMVDSTGSADFVNVSDLSGRDFLQAVEIGEAVDDTGPSGSVSLLLRFGEASLSPTAADDTRYKPGGVPFVQIGRDVEVYTALVPWDTPPPPDGSDFWKLMLQGTIDRDPYGEPGAGSLVLELRDVITSRLVDEWIEVQTPYGGGGDLIEDVIFDILNDHLSTPPALSVPVPSAFAINAYNQQKEPVIQACRVLAQGTIGWDLRVRWESGAFLLALYEPERTSPTSSWTFTRDEWRRLEVAQSREDVRNRVFVAYTDAATGARLTESAIDAASVAKYGPRFMEIGEVPTSQIDTDTEAQALADTALADLSEPDVVLEAEVDYFWPVQINDFYTFEADGPIFGADQDAAVVSYRHVIADGVGITRLGLRGRPSLGADRWLAVEARPGRTPAADHVAPATPAGLTITELPHGFEARWTRPTEKDWDSTEVEVQNDASPGVWVKYAETRAQGIAFYGLSPTQQYTVRVRHRDRMRNPSAYQTSAAGKKPLTYGGGASGAITQGAIPFGSASNTYTEDATNLYFDDATNEFKVGGGIRPVSAGAQNIGLTTAEWNALLLGEGTSSGVTFGLSQQFRAYFDGASTWKLRNASSLDVLQVDSGGLHIVGPSVGNFGRFTVYPDPAAGGANRAGRMTLDTYPKGTTPQTQQFFMEASRDTNDVRFAFNLGGGGVDMSLTFRGAHRMTTTNRLGVNELSPLTRLHVTDGTPGGDPTLGADVVALIQRNDAGSTEASAALVGGASAYVSLWLGDQGAYNDGGLRFDNLTRTLWGRAAGLDSMVLSPGHLAVWEQSNNVGAQSILSLDLQTNDGVPLRETYARLLAEIVDDTDDAEDGVARLLVLQAAALVEVAMFGQDIRTNGKISRGLLLQQGGADDFIQGFDSSDVAHGVTDVAPTTMYGGIAKVSAGGGGLEITGIRATAVALSLVGIASTGITTKSAGANAAIQLEAKKKSGTGVGAFAADENLVAILNNGTTLFIFDADGESYQQGGTAWIDFDDEDDLALLHAFRATFGNQSDLAREKARARARVDATYAEQIRRDAGRLQERKIVARKGRQLFASNSRYLRLLGGATEQLHGMHLALVDRVRQLEAIVGGRSA